MLTSSARKYIAPAPPALPHRCWPDRQIARAPIWLSTDLRDGNQALFEPMSVERKLTLFSMLVGLGFKQIEVAFPAASQADFAFTRRLIEDGLIPDDVTIMVMTPAREPLIRRTFEALRGCSRAIISLFNATAPVWRRDVYGLSQAEVMQMAVQHARLVAQLAQDHPGTQWTLQYSPEAFSATELPFAADVCNAVVAEALGSLRAPVIINLPATVEISTPNVFADQVEWMNDHLDQREQVVLSVHPHNDRGTAVAAAELALMAGAQRVEGCLLGNGERSGNVDLLTLALNLYTHGVEPGLDFSHIDQVVRTVEACSGIPVHPRHPYAGELVYTAFSGSHQDAIRKGLQVRKMLDADAAWEVPYLPIDPADLGRRYESVIRVNSQSGKGGIAHVLDTEYGLKLPRRMLIEFSGVVQGVVDKSGAEIKPDELMQLWLQTYVNHKQGMHLLARSVVATDEQRKLTMTVSQPDAFGRSSASRVNVSAEAGSVLDAACLACTRLLGQQLEIGHIEQQMLSLNGQAVAVAIAETYVASDKQGLWAAALNVDHEVALLQAMLNSISVRMWQGDSLRVSRVASR
jgi:2-isopropylmalate synthase